MQWNMRIHSGNGSEIFQIEPRDFRISRTKNKECREKTLKMF